MTHPIGTVGDLPGFGAPAGRAIRPVEAQRDPASSPEIIFIDRVEFEQNGG